MYWRVKKLILVWVVRRGPRRADGVMQVAGGDRWDCLM